VTGEVAIDSSALVAVLNLEPDGEGFAATLIESPAIIGAPTVLEVRIWCLRQLGRSGDPWLEDWLDRRSTRVVPFDTALERLAASAYDRFGKGCHSAALNFGDAMTYAVAVHHDLPLLFKGRDFGKTDVRVHQASEVRA